MMGALVAPALYLPERVVGRQGAEHAYESDNTYVGLVKDKTFQQIFYHRIINQGLLSINQLII